jgi:hypothetical protein
MNAFRYLAIILSLSVIVLIQSCGSGSSDTAGALTMSAATIVDNKDGTATVSTTVTFSPPAGKSAQGVVVSVRVSDGLGNFTNDSHTLTSGSNSFNYSFLVTQSATSTTPVSITASIGDMSSSVLAVVPIKAP